jgi:hypothetical protein
MNSQKNILKVTGVALVALAGSITAAACSSSSNNPPSTQLEAGSSSSGAGSSGAGTSSSSSGAGTSSSSSGGTSSSSSGASSGGGSCAPDGGPDAQCNSCATIGGDGGLGAYNTCSAIATVNCTPFNNAARGVPSTLPTP